MPPPGLSLVSMLALIACSGQMLAAVLLARRYGGRSSATDRWILCWLFYDVIVHLTLEGPFVYMSLVGTVETSEGPLAELWKEYGRADGRWLVSDPTIVAIEILTAGPASLLGVLLIHAVLHDKYYRHFLQVCLSVCELYGGWMTFAPDWLQGSPHLDTTSWLHLWLYLVFFNGVWVLVPALLLGQSWLALRRLHALRPHGHTGDGLHALRPHHDTGDGLHALRPHGHIGDGLHALRPHGHTGDGLHALRPHGHTGDGLHALRPHAEAHRKNM